MKLLFFVIFLFCALCATAGNSNALDSISELEWKNRIVFVSGSDDDLASFTENQDEITDRHIIWFLFAKDSVHSNSEKKLSKALAMALRANYFKNNTKAILIGKDGGVKSEQTLFDLLDFLSLIDTMPMRLEEMQH